MGYDCEAAINFSMDAIESQKLDAGKKATLEKTLDYLRSHEIPLKNKYMFPSFFTSLNLKSNLFRELEEDSEQNSKTL